MFDRSHLRSLLGGSHDAASVDCEASFDDHGLVLDARGVDLADPIRDPRCVERLITALRERSVDDIRIEQRGVTYGYDRESTAFLTTAGEFAATVAVHDEALSARVSTEPIRAATEAAARVGPAHETALETGFHAYADADSLEAVLSGHVAPSIAAARIEPAPPTDAHLLDATVLDSGASARLYETDEGRPVYHLEPLEYTFGTDAFAALARARDHLADSAGGDRAPFDAVAAVAEDDQPVGSLGRALTKHSRGYGILEDFFADARIDEVYVNAPADETPIHVRVDDRAVPTNVRLTERGAKLVASRIRMDSGRPFSRASPTIDSVLTDVGGRDAIRVAGVRPPASDGVAFAFRAEATDEWRLGTLVDVGTLTPDAAGFLSLAMESGAAILVAGPRGAGKTTLASSLLWEVPADERIVAIEDTPELPIRAIQSADRDAQRLGVSTDAATELSPAAALRTALRLGDGALVVGEVRGEEAAVLYEAMRVGAASSAVLGTIHGEGAAGVRERVVSDLGVSESSFQTTDLVVTITPKGTDRRVTRIEEVTASGAELLFAFGPDGLEQTGRVGRGNSDFVSSMAAADGTYADVLEAIDDRTARFREERRSQPGVVTDR